MTEVIWHHRLQQILPPASKSGGWGATAKQSNPEYKQQANRSSSMFSHHKKGHAMLANDIQPEWKVLATRRRLIIHPLNQ